jgi:hypothetical protein
LEDPSDLDNVKPSLLTTPPLLVLPLHPKMRPSAKARAWMEQQETARSRRRTKKSEIASICLFVDPRPAEGVHAVLGMRWAASSRGNSPVASPMASPVGSPVGRPVPSPIVPSFGAMMEAPASTFASAGHPRRRVRVQWGGRRCGLLGRRWSVWWARVLRSLGLGGGMVFYHAHGGAPRT